MTISAHSTSSISVSTDSHRETLGLWDVVSLTIGIVVGVSIFKVPGEVFLKAGSPLAGMLIWVAGALLALAGAMCYAELSAAYPQFGAEYVYLGRAYGRRIAFLFGWLQTLVILPASVGAMSFVFATYAGEFSAHLKPYPGLLAAAAIGFLSVLQWMGFQVGRIAQNLLTTIKAISLVGVLICGLSLTPVESVLPATTSSSGWNGLGLALIFVLYAYGGWSDVAIVTPEVRNCRRNIPRGLMMGLMLITALYLLLNFSFLKGLGYADVCRIPAPAAEVVRRALGPASSRTVSLIIMASALGAIHGMLFSGCRLLPAIGEDFPLFHKWTIWNQRQVPTYALATLSTISLLMTIVVGTAAGQQQIDSMMVAMRLTPPRWEDFGGGFEVLVAASSSIFWGFFMLSGIALIVLRYTDPDRSRSFRVPLYPATPILFAGTSAYMLWSSCNFAGRLTVLLLPVIVVGIILAIIQKMTVPSETVPNEAVPNDSV